MEKIIIIISLLKMWDTAKAVHKGKFMESNAYIRTKDLK